MHTAIKRADQDLTGSEVTTLAHEVVDHAVEVAALEVQGLAHLADALLAGAQSAEVLGGLGCDVSTQLHDLLEV